MVACILKNVSDFIVQDFVDCKMYQPGLYIVYAKMKTIVDRYDTFNYYKVVCIDDNGKTYTFTKILSSFENNWILERN